MARYYRRRRRFYRRKSWSSRITNFSGEQQATSGNNFIVYTNLAQNPAQSDSTISQKYTVKNINCQLEIECDSTNFVNVENLQAFVMFIPQGYIPTGTPSAYADVPYNHPEWILTHRFIGSAINDTQNAGYPPVRLYSRLSRKLDTGDRLVLIILGKNTATNSVTIGYKGIVKYNTKAN